ncbi:MAG: chemotaxis protein [Nitrosopumilus sp.]|nr:chemotaxis protein [Nitrosopumilus sp.]
MAIKEIKKKTDKIEDKTKKAIKREPTSAALLKKVASVSDSSKALQKEIKVMSKIFGDNQKVLVSMKEMIDTLTSTLENIQRQSKQINILEDDTQKLYAGLNQVRSQSNIVAKIHEQTTKLQEEVNKINDLQKSSPKTQELSHQIEDSMNSIKNNSQMIIKIAQRIDEVRDDLRKVSGKSDSFLDIGNEIDNLKNSIQEMAKKTDSLEINSQIISSFKQELVKITDNVNSASKLSSELAAIKVTIDAISGKASKIDSLGGVIDGLKRQVDTVAINADSASNLSINTIKSISGKVDKIETEINSLAHRADSTAFVGEGLKSVQEDFSDFKQNVFEKTNIIEEKISSVSDILKRQDASVVEFHRKSDKIFEEMQSVKNVTNKVSKDSSKEVMALLKLSEYQSNIRMHSESKYGDAKDLENMASQTADIVNLFDKLAIESGEKIPLPHEVRQWAVSKILDCADKWEIRFSDIFTILTNAIGKELLKEAIRIQQIRDIYGIRAVDEIRKELNIA